MKTLNLLPAKDNNFLSPYFWRWQDYFKIRQISIWSYNICISFISSNKGSSTVEFVVESLQQFNIAVWKDKFLSQLYIMFS